MPGIAVDDIFRISGFVMSRTSVVTLVDGIPYQGITEVNFEEAREGEIVHGQRTDGQPLGVTSGLYMPGALTFKAYLPTAAQIEEQLTVEGLGSFGSYLFDFILEIFENPLLPSISVVLTGCKIEGRKLGIPTDTGALVNEYTCKFLGATTVAEGNGVDGIPTFLANVGGVTNGL
jgi:hypothetical protein